MASTGTTMKQATTKPLRVLIITAAYPSAGNHMGAFLEREVEGLRKHGLDITIMHLQGKGKYARGMWQTFLTNFDNRFDIIHGQYSYGGAVALAQVRQPKVITFWGTDVLKDPAQDSRQNQFSRAISPWLARHADACTVPFAKMAEELHSPNVVIIPQGIDFAKFHPMPQAEARQTLGLDPDLAHRYILFCANPAWPRKGYFVVEEAVRLMRQHGAPLDILVANGLPHEQIMVYMNACDILAVPSSLESGPYVVKEAMACNLPVVSTDVGDVRTIIGQTEGCAIAERTGEDFARKMWKSLHTVRRTTGFLDIAHLSHEQLVTRIIAVYEQVLSKRKP